MAVLDKIEQKAEQALEALRPAAQPIPKDVQERITRGKSRLEELKPQRRLAVEFTDGKHYGFLAEDGMSVKHLATLTQLLGGKKADHRVRRSHDLIGPMVQSKVSAATQRVPGYEVNPSTNDPEDYTAAQIAKKIAYAGYELWRIKRATQKLVWNALVTEEGFIMAYWDSSIGPYVDVQMDPEGEPEHVGTGDVRIGVWNGLEVMSEPGVDFEESRWWAIEHARPIDAVEAEPDYVGGKLPANAELEGKLKKAESSNLCMITEFLERPSAKYPQGRRIFAAAGKQIFPEEGYPLTNAKGQVVDEPCIHRLGYTVNPASDRDKGLVRSLIESMRTYDFAQNKIAEFAQEGLVPKTLAPIGAFKAPATDEPGAREEYDPTVLMGGKIEFAPTQGIPPELFKLKEEALSEMRFEAHDNEVPSQVSANQAVQSILQKDEIAWEDLIANLAEVHSRIMRDCCSGETLVQTKDGLRLAQELAGETVETLTQDGEYRPARWASYGKRQLWRVEFEDGETGYFTKGHQWVVQRRGKGRFARATTDQLAGERIPLSGRAPRTGVEDRERWEEGIRNGMIYGDGNASTNVYKPTGSTYSYSRMMAYGEDKCSLAEEFFDHGERKTKDGLVQMPTKCYAPDLKAIPALDEGRDYLLGFIAGALATDGHVDSGMGLSSVKRDDLVQIREIAQNLGLLTTSIRHSVSKTGYVDGEHECWTLGFATRNFIDERGLDYDLVLRKAHRTKFLEKATWFKLTTKKVKAVAPSERVEEVFCCEEPETNTWVTGSGYVTSNCLTLVQRHYTEDRMLKFRGRTGWMPIEDFKGADLRDQTDVRVQPGSLTPFTRSAIEQRIQNIAQMFPGYFPPEVLLSAMNNGNAEGLLEGYEEDVGRINYIINQIRAGALEQMGMRPVWPGEEAGFQLNVETEEPEIGPDGQPVMETEVPAWMPRPGVDNYKVWTSVLANWAKSDEFAHLDEEAQKAAMLVFSALRDLEMREAQREQELKTNMAEEAGLSNAAAAPQKPMPSLPRAGGTSEGSGSPELPPGA